MRHIPPTLLRMAACAFLVLPSSSCDRPAQQSKRHTEPLAIASSAPPLTAPPVKEPLPELSSSNAESELPTVGATGSEPIYNVGDEVLKPEKISAEYPDLVSLMRAHRIRGPTIFQVVITKEGRVRDVRFLKLGASELAQPIRDALETWRFKPATLHGEPVAVYYNLTLHIRLQ